MGMISASFEWAVDQWALSVIALSFIYNLLFRTQNKHILYTSGAVLLMYVAGHWLLAIINALPIEAATNYRYSSRLVLYALGIILVSFIAARIGADRSIKFTLLVLVFCIVWQLALHIDRNVIGLDMIGHYFETGEIVDNQFSYWWLWDWYTFSLNLSSGVLFVYFCFGERSLEPVVKVITSIRILFVSKFVP